MHQDEAYGINLLSVFFVTLFRPYDLERRISCVLRIMQGGIIRDSMGWIGAVGRNCKTSDYGPKRLTVYII